MPLVPLFGSHPSRGLFKKEFRQPFNKKVIQSSAPWVKNELNASRMD